MTDRLPTIREFHADPNATPIARLKLITRRWHRLLRGGLTSQSRESLGALSAVPTRS